MTTLLIETLETELFQDIRLSSDERYSIGAIIPYLYLHNAPAGTFTLSLMKQAETLFSKSFNSEDIKAAINSLGNYAHVFYPVIPDYPIQLESGTYKVKLTTSGYAPTSISFLAWIRQHEDLNARMDYVPASDDQNPLAIRIKVFKRGEL